MDKRTDSECWPWTGAKHPTGYGKLWVHMPNYCCKPAHHVSLILSGISVPKGSVVMHSCDNPSCVNPNHLSVGTQQNNIADKLAKGRQPVGSKHHNTTISEAQVAYIRSSSKTGKELAEELGVSRGAVSRIRNFKARTQ